MKTDGENRYKICRMNAGLTQEQAATLLHVSSRTISDYENDNTPVSQDMVAAMVKVYRTPTLAWWYVRYSNPDLAPYLTEPPKFATDGDAMFQLELAEDHIAEIRSSLKAILSDGRVTHEEAERLKINAHTLRMAASRFMEAAGYLEERTEDE